MANVPIWKGSSALTEQPDSPSLEFSKDGPRCIRVWMGPYAVVVAAKPARLSVVAGTDASLQVDTVSIKKAPGGKGVLTVTLSPAPVQDYTFGENVTLELEWIEVQKKLETLPLFMPADPTTSRPAGAKALTDADLDAIETWKNSGTAPERTTSYSALSVNAKKFVDKLRRGTDSYVVYSPLCRRTTKSAAPPGKDRCGVRDNPPAEIKVDGYIYIKTADRISRDRTWTRTEEWTGADSVDADIYPTHP